MSFDLETEIIPFDHASLSLAMSNPSVLAYVQLRQGSCTSYKDDWDLKTLIMTFSASVQNRSAAQVQASASAGNAEDVLELGLRLYTGCGILKDCEGALICFLRLAEERMPNHIPNVSRSIRARACALLANANFEDRIDKDSPDTWNVDALYRAGMYADRCAALGFTPPIVLLVAKITEKAGFRRAEDNRFPQYSTVRFARLEHLWEVFEKRNAEVEGNVHRQDTKVGKRPNAYRCAAEGCGIEATKKSGLMRCAGPCAGNTKPSYCSKQCQTRDWKRHKPFCRGKAQEKDIQPQSRPLGDSSTTIGTDDEPLTSEQSDAIEASSFRDDGKQLVIEVPDTLNPGQTSKISSKTMSPEFMKEFRDGVKKLVEERRD